MTDIFISYSRKDKEFVKRLHVALETNSRDVWVDWENIPLTADWLEEIYTGIESANAFAYVITPDSVRSEVCSLELMHAIEHNKRLVPILRRELVEEADRAALHPSISSHNWIFFNEDNDTAFDTAFKTLQAALDTDLEHLQVHTRLLVRAVEWHDKDQDTSFLLRGSDLKEAETWLANSAGKQPIPTDRQVEYIGASRKAATARRRVVIITGVYVVIVAALAIFAFTQALSAESRRQEAEVERGRAEANAATAVSAQSTAQYNAQQARSLALASSAQQALYRDNDVELAIALALAANDFDAPSALAQSVLAQAAYAPGVRFVRDGYADYGSRVSVSPDGARVLTATDDGGVAIVDLTTGEQLHKWDLDGRQAWGLDFSLDGAYIVSSFDDGTVTVYDAATYDAISTFTAVDPATLGEAAAGPYVWVAAFSQDGSDVVTGAEEGRLQLWDWRSGELIRSFEGHTRAIWGVDFSPDNQFVVSSSEDGYIIRWNLSTGEEVQRFNPDPTADDSVWDVAYSPDGATVLAGYEDNSLRLWDLESGREIYRFIGHTNRVWDVAYSPDSHTAVSGSYDNKVKLWNLSTGDEIRTYNGHESAMWRWCPRWRAYQNG